MNTLSNKIATSVFSDDAGTSVKVVYYNTIIVKITQKNIILNTGGWNTLTTKRRMNQASEHFSLGFHVYQKNGVWLCDYRSQTFKFIDDILVLKAED